MSRYLLIHHCRELSDPPGSVFMMGSRTTQLGLALPDPKRRGGKRRGAGRRRAPGSRDPEHRARDTFARPTPVHTVLRVRQEVGRLRRGEILEALRHALGVVTRGDRGFRVVHYSLQHNHLHFLVEADDTSRLAAGMQTLAISAARAINRACGRTGRVFEHRFHSTVIGSPRQAQHVLAYVLGNWRRHNEDERNLATRSAMLDPYSSGTSFSGWSEPTAWAAWPGWGGYRPLPVSPPATWLLSIGWTRTGGALDPWRTPGPMPR